MTHLLFFKFKVLSLFLHTFLLVFFNQSRRAIIDASFWFCMICSKWKLFFLKMMKKKKRTHKPNDFKLNYDFIDLPCYERKVLIFFQLTNLIVFLCLYHVATISGVNISKSQPADDILCFRTD